MCYFTPKVIPENKKKAIIDSLFYLLKLLIHHLVCWV
jgi:hypothetical protein